MTAVLDARAEAVAFVRDRAAALDRNTTDVRTDLTELGRLGLLGIGLGEPGIEPIVGVVEAVAGESLAVGFSLWAQRMTIEYVSRAPEPVRAAHLDGLVSGRTVGVTAMAAALKHLAGLGPLPLAADGDRVSGPIAWASNVFPDALIVFPFRDGSGRGHVGCTRTGAPGVQVAPAPELLALGATASTSLRFTDVAVEQRVTGDLKGFCGAIRPTFLLLQSAFCTGIARTALTEAAGRLDGLGEEFRTELESLTARGDDLRHQLYRHAADPGAAGPAELLEVRLGAARLAVEATRLEFALRGGAGYATASATNRRFREAAFLPIQSPSEGQLRWELSQYE